MSNDVGLCIVCKKNPIPSGYKKFCSRECYFKNQTKVARIKRQSMPKEVEVFPIWICPNGHKHQLDFSPIKDKKKWDNHVCPDCPTNEDMSDHIKAMISN